MVQPRARSEQRTLLWALVWIGVVNAVIGLFTLWTLGRALQARALPDADSHGIGSLSGGAEQAEAALDTWARFAESSATVSGDVVARAWLVVDAIVFASLGYGLISVATVLLVRGTGEPTSSQRWLRRAAMVGIAIAVVDVVETILSWIVIGRDGGGPAGFLRWWTAGKWALTAVVCVPLVVAIVAVVRERTVRRRLRQLSDRAPTTRRWSVDLVVTAGLLALAIVLLVVLAERHVDPGWVAVAAIVFGYAAFRFNATLEARRADTDDGASVRLRVLIGAELIVVGACLVVSWVFGSPPAGVGFIGLIAALFGASSLLGEFRWNDSNARRWVAIALVGLAGAVGLVGLFSPAPFVGLALLFVAVFLLGVVGLSAVTEDVMRRLAATRDDDGWLVRRHHLVFLVAGTLIVAVAAVWARAVGWEWRNMLLGAAVLAVFALVLGSNWSSEAFIAIGVVVIIWALSPSVAEISDTITPVEGDEVMAVLGDSYTSGEGGSSFFEGTNTSRAEVENKCRRSPNAYSVRLAEDPADPVPSRIVFVACSGADVANIVSEAQYVNEPPRNQDADDDGAEQVGLAQLAHVDWVATNLGDDLDISTVLVGTGGNDAGFGDVVATCVLPGDCSELAARWIEDLQALRPKLEDTYRTIREHFGENVLYVAMPYPVPIGPTSCSASHYTDDEHLLLYNYANALNAAVRGAAASTGFHVIDDVETAFVHGGNGICTAEEQGDLAINYLAAGQEGGVFEDRLTPTNWLHNSMHPNDDGHALVAAAAADWFEREQPEPLPDPQGHGGPATLTVEELIGRADRYCSQDPSVDPPAACEHEGYEWAAAQGQLSVRRHAVLALAAFAGIWLIVVEFLLLWRSDRGRSEAATDTAAT